MSNYTNATLSDGSKVVLYRAGNQGNKNFYWVAQVRSGSVKVGTWVSRTQGSLRFAFETMK